MGAYEEHLRHVAEPQAPSEREKAVSTTLDDYEALWFTDHLRDYAYYADHDDGPNGGIAVAYASYIDQTVRKQAENHVTLYVHTRPAAETLVEAVEYAASDVDFDAFPTVLYLSVSNAVHAVLGQFDDDYEPPEVIELGGEETVAFDEIEAVDSYAEMRLAEAENEAMQQMEEAAEGRDIRNRPERRVDPRREE